MIKKSSLTFLTLIVSLGAVHAQNQDPSNNSSLNTSQSTSVSSSSSASPGVSIYGRAQVGAEQVRVGPRTQSRINSENSYLGLKLREDLNGQTSVYGILEAGVNIDDGTQTNPTFRRSILGLSNPFYGDVWLGRDESAYYRAGRPFDPFYNLSAASTSSLLGQTVFSNSLTPSKTNGFNQRVSNSVGYTSPKWFNTTFSVTYGANEKSVLNDSSVASVAANFSSGPWSAMGAYERQNYTGLGLTGNNRDKAYKAGVGYDFGATRVTFVGEHASNLINRAPTSIDYSRNAYSLGATHTIGSHEILGAYTKAQAGRLSGAVTPDYAANQVSLGYKYNFSKRTSLMSTASWIHNGTAANYDLATRGVLPLAGESIRLVNVGLVHAF